jgi:cyclic pyranopterin phosphate synthase
MLDMAEINPNCLFNHIGFDSIIRHRYIHPCITESEKTERKPEPTLTQLTDPYNRPINSLRISLTQRCNFDCFFCHREGEHDPHGEMTAREIETIVEVAAGLGIRKVKLTGGEPMLRGDLVDIVARIAPHLDEVSMTTNASLLPGKACELKEAGLDRVNVSLHTLDGGAFEKITGVDQGSEVRDGIEEAVRCGLNPVKINMVVMRGVNDSEVPAMIEYSRDVGAVLQLIEFQELEHGAEHYDALHHDLTPLEGSLEEQAERVVEREMHHRRVYHLRGGAQVEVVRPMHNSVFCAFCTRLRVTSDGRLKACLMRDDNLVPLMSLIRGGASSGRLEEAFREAVARRRPFWRD